MNVTRTAVRAAHLPYRVRCLLLRIAAADARKVLRATMMHPMGRYGSPPQHVGAEDEDRTLRGYRLCQRMSSAPSCVRRDINRWGCPQPLEATLLKQQSTLGGFDPHLGPRVLRTSLCRGMTGTFRGNRSAPTTDAPWSGNVHGLGERFAPEGSRSSLCVGRLPLAATALSKGTLRSCGIRQDPLRVSGYRALRSRLSEAKLPSHSPDTPN